MKLTKQTKTLIGVGVLGVAAYLIWKQNQEKKNFGGFSKLSSRKAASNCDCYGNNWTGSRGKKTTTLSDGTALCENSYGFIYGCNTKGQLVKYN